MVVGLIIAFVVVNIGINIRLKQVRKRLDISRNLDKLIGGEA